MSTQNSFLQESVQFLKTKTPTDELDDPIHINNMPKVEQWVLEVKKRWLATPYPKQLAAIISRVIEDRQDEPIYNAICLGMSGDYPAWEVQQFVVFSQIMAQLATANPDLLNNILFQDPIARPYWKEVVQNHGCQVVETPAAFMEGLKAQPVGELALFVGDDIRDWIGDKHGGHGIPPEEHDHFAAIATTMLDEHICNHELLPCDRSNGMSYLAPGPWKGLSGLQMWWRPARTELQKAQDQALLH